MVSSSYSMSYTVALLSLENIIFREYLTCTCLMLFACLIFEASLSIASVLFSITDELPCLSTPEDYACANRIMDYFNHMNATAKRRKTTSKLSTHFFLFCLYI